jgi:hypothetical protein
VAFTVYPDGYVEVPLQSFAVLPPFDRLEARREIQRRLNEIPQVSVPDDRLDKYPSVPLAALADDPSFGQFTNVID